MSYWLIGHQNWSVFGSFVVHFFGILYGLQVRTTVESSLQEAKTTENPHSAKIGRMHNLRTSGLGGPEVDRTSFLSLLKGTGTSGII